MAHSIHCRGYRGVTKGFDDLDCDCGETIKRLRTALATIDAWQVDPSERHGDTLFKALWECRRIAAEALGKAGADSHVESEEAVAPANLKKNTPTSERPS